MMRLIAITGCLLIVLAACSASPGYVPEPPPQAIGLPLAHIQPHQPPQPVPVIEAEDEPVAPPAYLAAMHRALDWIREQNPSPRVGSVGGEWAVVALARAGVTDDAWFAHYLASLDAALAGQGGRVERLTDYARVTLALSALGRDAATHDGRDVTAPLRTFTPTLDRPYHSRSINADIFALIALDSRPYTGGRDELVRNILAAEMQGGGWGLSVGPAPEITAMAIAALAPYYGINTDVRAAVDRALGMFGGHTLPDAESNAQMIVALAALGRDAQSYVDALLTFQDSATGAFLRGGQPNMMTTEQAAYALVAHHRFLSGQNALFDMRDAASGG